MTMFSFSLRDLRGEKSEFLTAVLSRAAKLSRFVGDDGGDAAAAVGEAAGGAAEAYVFSNSELERILF